MTPYYDRGGHTIYLASCLDVLPQLEAGTIDLLLTDPPYGLSGKQDEAAIAMADRADFRRHFGEWDKEWSPAALLAEADRLLRPGGALIAFMAHEWIAAYAETPLLVKKFGVWGKPNPAPRVRPGYQHATEFWTWQAKAGRPPTWNGGFTQSNLIINPVCAGAERTDHPTQKPLRLMRGFVLRHSDPGDLILDPFSGSGTTGRACKDLGRRSISIEVNEQWAAAAARRLEQEVFDFEPAPCVVEA